MSTSRFSANVLGVGQESIAWCFGAKSLSATERFAQIPWHVEDGVPVLDEARVVYVCSVESVAAFGSQDIVIGRVRTCTVRDASAAPLLHYNGAMTTIQDSAHQDLAAPD